MGSVNSPFVIITGLSGSGKGTVLKVFEDLGYFCVDNLPLELVPKFVELCERARAQIKQAAIVIDVREGSELTKFPKLYQTLKKNTLTVTLIYLQATKDSLIRRYSETRRPHPLKLNQSIAEALEEEQQRLIPIKKLADQIIDTTKFNVHELKRHVIDKFQTKKSPALLISLVSFGFKHGIPTESDLVFDVRFLPNPNYIRNLKHKNGNDPEVVTYIEGFKQTLDFLGYLENFLLFLIPQYIGEGRSYLTIAIGCTGGQHRSVMLTNRIKYLLTSHDFNTKMTHRDLNLH
ncbi:MAG: RNase adapter RapZ [Acidobacteriia bacterium]|nr:RNase adapter RapZ [Terriglobia bacterium]